MLKETICVLCENKKQDMEIVYPANFVPSQVDKSLFSARRPPDKIHYQIVRCLGCGLVRSNPILPPQKIASFYKKSEIKYQKETSYLRRTYGYYLKKKVLPLFGYEQKKSLLDIGCGNGFFLKEALAIGFNNVYGVEPGTKAVAKASLDLQDKIKTDFFSADLFPPGNFDVVTCFHTLDHVPNPQQFVQDVYTVLKPNGVAFFIVHNADSWSQNF